MRHAALLLLMALPLLTAAALPRTGPVPAEKPVVEGDARPGPADGPVDTIAPGAAPVPTPEPKPARDGPDAASPAPQAPADAGPTSPPPAEGNTEKSPPAADGGKQEQVEPPEDGRGTDGGPKGEEPRQPAGEAPKPTLPPPPPIAAEDPGEFKACLADLAALGTRFKATGRIDDGEGCGIDQPLEVAEVLPGIDAGGAQMRCETARALAHWLKDTVNPALEIALPHRKITGLTTGSTYACRLRNGASEGKISEHARGNAIDIAAFRLDDGTEITMKPRAEDGTMEGAFQRTATAGACLHFSTVLAPGSDAAHQDHLHLDMLERESGYRYCR